MALNNVPLPGQNLLQTRDPINENFSDIDTAFSVNHVAYNDADQGKHKWVTFPQQMSDPATGANENLLFSKTVSGLLDLYYRNQNNGSIYNMTGSNIASVGATGRRNGYFYVGGFLVKFGYVNVAPGTNNQNFPANDAGGQPVPAFTNCIAFGIFNGALTAADQSVGSNGTHTNLQFSVTNIGSTVVNNCLWIAIGY